jgi:hypothetical protein
MGWSVATPAIAGVGAGAVAIAGSTTVDKLQHVGVSGAATLALGTLGISPGVAAGTVFVGATVGKELIMDLALGMGTPSVMDATANLAGSLLGYAALKAMQNKSKPTLLT